MHSPPRRGRPAALALALALLALALLVAACGGDDDEARHERRGARSSAAPAEATTAAAETSAPAEPSAPAETEAPAETSAPAESQRPPSPSARGAAAGEFTFEGEPTEISFLYSPFTDYAPFFVAKDKGYFDDFGVDVDAGHRRPAPPRPSSCSPPARPRPVAPPGARLLQLHRARARRCRSSPAGHDARRTGQARLAAHRLQAGAATPASKTVADLTGKKIGQPGPGGFGEYSVALALDTGGLTLDDVEIVNIGPPDAAAALDNGGIDASWTHRALRHAVRAARASPASVSEDHAAGVELGFIAFNADFAEGQRGRRVRFIAAYLKAARELDNGGWDDPEIREIVAKYTELPVERSTRSAAPSANEDGAFDLESMRDQEAFFREQRPARLRRRGRPRSSFDPTVCRRPPAPSSGRTRRGATGRRAEPPTRHRGPRPLEGLPRRSDPSHACSRSRTSRSPSTAASSSCLVGPSRLRQDDHPAHPRRAGDSAPRRSPPSARTAAGHGVPGGLGLPLAVGRGQRRPIRSPSRGVAAGRAGPRVDELLELTGLADFRARPARTSSRAA